MVDKLDLVLDRVADLSQTHASHNVQQQRIRDLMNGGANGMRALLGESIGDLGIDLPVANYMLTAMSRLAQKVGRMPTLKIDTSSRESDSQKARDDAAKRERIVLAYDTDGRLIMQMPQVGRWLPAYGFAVWVLRGRRNDDGYYYPAAELRDPFDCVMGDLGPDQQPRELGIFRSVSRKRLAMGYPAFADLIIRGPGAAGGSRRVWGGKGSWENPTGEGIEVVEFMDETGTYVVVPEIGKVVDFVGNKLASGPAFVVAKRFSFDQPQGHYDQLIGLMAQIAKLNILAVIAAEDEVFTETNVIGHLMSGEYAKGRDAINILEAGSRVEKPSRNLALGVFGQIDRLERQLRIGASYPVSDDADTNSAWVTGRGQQELKSAVNLEIDEYHTVLGDALERLDSKRLEWDEACYPDERKTLAVFHQGKTKREEYTPRTAIDGHYRTRRVYGVMAGWDESTKIVTGLQLLQAEIIDPLTLQENLDGLENLTAVNDRIRERKAESVLFDMLGAAASQQPPDPTAALALVDIKARPHEMDAILTKYFTPQEPQVDPNEQMFLDQAAGGPPSGGLPGPPPDVQTVLSQLKQGGSVGGGGIQTVGQF